MTAAAAASGGTSNGCLVSSAATGRQDKTDRVPGGRADVVVVVGVDLVAL